MMWVDVASCKRRIAMVWLIGGGIIFFLVLFQTLLGRYGSEPAQAWGWMLPTITPTLMLIVGVYVAEAGHQRDQRLVGRFLFRLSMGLSIAYLAVVLLTLLVQPISPIEPMQMFKISHLWLAPLQGLASASLGAFFVRRKPDDAHVPPQPPAPDASSSSSGHS